MTSDDKEKIKNEIETLKKVLDEIISGRDSDLNSNEILLLSQKLDDFILEYLKLVDK